jgi:transmembrane sensor
LLLIARQHGASTEAAQVATETLERWRAREPANEQAAQAAMAAGRDQGSALQGEMPLPATHSARVQQTRRRALSVLSLVWRAWPACLAAGIGCSQRSRWRCIQAMASN